VALIEPVKSLPTQSICNLPSTISIYSDKLIIDPSKFVALKKLLASKAIGAGAEFESMLYSIFDVLYFSIDVP
jgi:hypothetical protein